MKFTVNYPTGNWFEDGTIEIGKVQEAEIFTRKDLDNLLDDIPEGEDYFLADTDGNRVEAYDIMKDLDEEDETEEEYYYWLDTTKTWNSPRKGEAILIRGQYNEDGEKDRDTEEEILEFTAADCGIIPDDNEAGEKIDAYITEQLGFLPDYEVN